MLEFFFIANKPSRLVSNQAMHLNWNEGYIYSNKQLSISFLHHIANQQASVRAEAIMEGLPLMTANRLLQFDI